MSSNGMSEDRQEFEYSIESLAKMYRLWTKRPDEEFSRWTHGANMN